MSTDDMKLIEIKKRNSLLTERLTEVWESSVRATHLFLREEEIERIKRYIPQAVREIPRLIVAQYGDGRPAAFMGINGPKLEMLFVASEERGKGIGKRLLQYGMERYGISELAVNEQNPQAKGFYEAMGFRVYKRTERDEQGGPYPLLYMRFVP